MYMPRVCEHEAECKFALREASYPTGAYGVGRGSIRMTNMQHALGVIELSYHYYLLPSNPGVRGCVASCLVRASRHSHWQLRMCIQSLLVIVNI